MTLSKITEGLKIQMKIPKLKNNFNMKLENIDIQKPIDKAFEGIEKIKKKRFLVLFLELIVFSLVVYLLIIVNKSNRKELWEFGGSDIMFEYKHAIQIGKGENIYKPILDQDLLTNRKYATLFPLYYYFLYIIAKISKIAGEFNFESFMDLHRSILFVAEIFTGVFIYLIFRKDNKHLLGVLAATFPLFNRWVINNVASGKQDIIAIAFLMSALYFLHQKTSINKPYLTFCLAYQWA